MKNRMGWYDKSASDPGSGLFMGSASIFLAFFAIDAYRIFVGLLETPSARVGHFEAGAGGTLMLMSWMLRLSAVLFAAASLFFRKTRVSFIARMMMVVLPITFFFTVPYCLEKQAKGFDESTFLGIRGIHSAGLSVTRSQARDALGDPLSIDHWGDRELWSYTYMPSTGFGWRKRILIFDESGMLIDVFKFDEP